MVGFSIVDNMETLLDSFDNDVIYAGYQRTGGIDDFQALFFGFSNYIGSNASVVNY